MRREEDGRGVFGGRAGGKNGAPEVDGTRGTVLFTKSTPCNWPEHSNQLAGACALEAEACRL